MSFFCATPVSDPTDRSPSASPALPRHLICLVGVRLLRSVPSRTGEVSVTREQRRLAAIVAADVVGYSRLMGRDESGTPGANCGRTALNTSIPFWRHIEGVWSS